MLTLCRLMEQYFLTIIALGFTSGIAAGLLGVGGGMILIPGLYFIGADQIHDSAFVAMCLGTTLACIFGTGLASTYQQNKTQNIDWNVVKKASFFLFLGTLIGAKISYFLSPIFLKILFCMLALYLAFKYLNIKMIKLNSSKNYFSFIQKSPSQLIFLVVGILSSWIGIGGGTLNTPYLESQNMPIKKAMGTSSALGVPIALGGIVGYLSDINCTVALIIVSASIFGAKWGVHLQNKLPSHKIKKIFGVFLILVALKMLSGLI
jgi:uncharacterized membrane protein YfcA